MDLLHCSISIIFNQFYGLGSTRITLTQALPKTSLIPDLARYYLRHFGRKQTEILTHAIPGYGYNRIQSFRGSLAMRQKVWNMPVADKSVLLEEHAREMIMLEEMHLHEVNKMLRKPGDVEALNGYRPSDRCSPYPEAVFLLQ